MFPFAHPKPPFAWLWLSFSLSLSLSLSLPSSLFPSFSLFICDCPLALYPFRATVSLVYLCYARTVSPLRRCGNVTEPSRGFIAACSISVVFLRLKARPVLFPQRYIYIYIYIYIFLFKESVGKEFIVTIKRYENLLLKIYRETSHSVASSVFHVKSRQAVFA